MKWMKISGVLGIGIFVLGLMYILTFFSLGLTGDWGNELLTTNFMVSASLLIFFLIWFSLIVYHFGLIKLGRLLQERRITFYSWSFVVMLILLPITALTFVFSLNLLFFFDVFFERGDNISILIMIIVLLVLMTVLIFYYIIRTRFSIGLISMSNKIKYAKTAGVLSLLFVNLIAVVYIFVVVFTFNWKLKYSIRIQDLGIGGILILFGIAYISIVVTLIILFFFIIQLLFESLFLLNASKKYENN